MRNTSVTPASPNEYGANNFAQRLDAQLHEGYGKPHHGSGGGYEGQPATEGQGYIVNFASREDMAPLTKAHTVQ